jgi:hypothetical protein
VKVRMCPARCISRGPSKQPPAKPRKYADPRMPIDTVEKPSRYARIGNRVFWRPFPVRRMATLTKSAATGASARIMASRIAVRVPVAVSDAWHYDV